MTKFFYVFEIVCPIPVPAGGTSEIKLGTDDFTLTQRMENGQAVPNSYWLKEKDDTSKHPIVSNRVDPNPTPLSPDEVALRNSLKDRSFEFGFIKGIGVGGKEMVVGTVKAGVGFVKWATDGLLLGSVLFNIVIKDAVGIHITEGEMQYAEMLNDRNEGINNAVVGLAQGLYKIYLWYVNNQINNGRMTIAFLTGDDAGFDASIMRTNELNSEIFEKGAEVISHTLEEFKLDPDGVKGYKVGRVVFEILSIVFPAGQLAKVSKLEFLQTIVTKTTSLGGATILKAKELLEKVRIRNFCFVAGTKVLAKDGLKNIEAIRPGDIVWSRDEFTKESDWRPVLETFITHPEEIFQLTYRLRGPPVGLITSENAQSTSQTLREETLGVTPPHPFFVISRSTPGFVPAGQLRAGDVLQLANDGTAVVVSITRQPAPDGTAFATYNFEVADFHTYFVGEAGVWVHNTCPWEVDKAIAIWDALRAETQFIDKFWDPMVAAFKTRERISDWDQRALYNHVMEEFRKSNGLPHECPPIPGVAKGDEYEHALDQFFRERAKWVEGNHMEGRPVPQVVGPPRSIPEADRIIDGVRTEYVRAVSTNPTAISDNIADKARDCIAKRAAELVVEVTDNPAWTQVLKEECINRARGKNPNVKLRFRNGNVLEE